MPLVRLQVRNEFGLGQPELYRESNREDPKAVLDGVAVAGLVGILRQLGDLAEYVFFDIIFVFFFFFIWVCLNGCNLQFLCLWELFGKWGWLISVVSRL